MARGEISGRKPRERAAASKKKPPARGPPAPTAMFSIASFCLAHGISQSFYFQLKAQGRGPPELHLGSRVFITFESAERWRLACEEATEKKMTA